MKKTNEILKLKKDLEIFRKKENNTSSEFPLPDEFKYRWETLVQTMLMDTFDIISQNNILLMRTINIILKNIMQITKMKINEKIMDILSYLGLKNINEIQIKNFFKKFKFSLFQDYFIYLFFSNNQNEKENISMIIEQIIKDIKSKEGKLFNNKEIELILSNLSIQDNDNLIKIIKEFYFLCLYMQINEPQLSLKISTDLNYKYFDKDEYINLEGFPSGNNDICLMIIDAPTIKINSYYKGIKPAVYIIENPSNEIKLLCEKQDGKEFLNNKKKSKSCNDINKIKDNKEKEDNIYVEENNNKNKYSPIPIYIKERATEFTIKNNINDYSIIQPEVSYYCDVNKNNLNNKDVIKKIKKGKKNKNFLSLRENIDNSLKELKNKRKEAISPKLKREIN